MTSASQQPAPPRFDGFMAVDDEKLLQWLAETAEDAMGLSYELNKLRSQNLTRGDVE
jgi:hypothetical protein